MIKAIISGNLGKDAEVANVGNSKVIRFSLAVHERYTDKQGNKVDKTEWIKASYWKNEGQSIKVSELLKKGKSVLIEGVPQAEGYTDKNGQVQSQLSIKVRELTILN